MNTTFFDTHCHLNFKRFNKEREKVMEQTLAAGVTNMMDVGTDIASSQKAVELAAQYPSLSAAVGIHPHHIYTYLDKKNNGGGAIESLIAHDLSILETLLQNPSVYAAGEIGLDMHEYTNTKYVEYTPSEEFLALQKEILIKQIHLGLRFNKSIILHNRETKQDLLPLLASVWDTQMSHHTVFHCCEADDELLSFAQEKGIFIGVDGDVTYGGEKAEFVKKIPLEMLVLETDSPFILPEPLKTQKLYPNTPANIPLIAQCVADLKGISIKEVARVTTENAKRLFLI